MTQGERIRVTMHAWGIGQLTHREYDLLMHLVMFLPSWKVER